MSPILPPGIYAPTPSFYKDDAEQTIDTETATRHALRLAKAGLIGIVLQGSTGEAVHLTGQERKNFIRSCRSSLNESGYKSFKIVAGAGGQSYLESLEYLKDAHEAGADAGIVLPPSYFPGQMNDEALTAYFKRLADASPIPFIIYNFPAVTNGINLSAAFLANLASHPKIIGCKLTCNTIGKMTYLSRYAGNLPPNHGEFSVFTGGSDFLIAAHAAGVAGAITGMSNLFPYTLVALWKAITDGDLERAQHIQAIVTRAEVSAVPGFIPTARAALRSTAGYGGKSRAPLYDVEDSTVKSWIDEIWKFEESLAHEAR